MAKLLTNKARQMWSVALLLLLIFPFLPEIIAYVLMALAKAQGCTLEQSVPCPLTPSMSIGDAIIQALVAGSNRGLIFAIGVAAIWLFVCCFVILQAWKKTATRLSLGFVVCTIFGALPYTGPAIVLGSLANPYCHTTSDVGIHKCMAYGVNIGAAAYQASGTQLLFYLGGPISFVCLLIYLIVVTVKARHACRLSPAE